MDKMDRKKLPIGIRSFREIREGGYYYADKTALAKLLIDKGKYNLLARPRRFGKTLLVDTLQEMFEGNEKLFRGLAIHDEWDWTVKYPVVRLDFSDVGVMDPDQLERHVMAQIETMEKKAGVSDDCPYASLRLLNLIDEINEKTGQPVVFLVDDYDKPILNALGTPAIAEANRRKLIAIYSITKNFRADIKFNLLTGVSETVLASHLSGGVNNLNHVTSEAWFSSICGYTDHDIDTLFAPELEGLDREKIREWYGGYSWSGEEKVYNPHNILQLLSDREFKARWFEDCTPSFLVDVLKRIDAVLPDPDGMLESSIWLMIREVENPSVTSLLFHTGYLTITGKERSGGESFNRLGYPNRDVIESLDNLPLNIQPPETHIRW